jgi:leader peptidase (prepilin peptidase) / N-methyltransferase
VTILIDVIALCLGLAFGSFANVIIFRHGVIKSNLSSRSTCLHCHYPISPRDNIPVISWLILRGKCRNCNAPISRVYPIVESATAILFLLFINAPDHVFESVGTPSFLARAAILVGLLWLAVAGVALAVIDFRDFVLPNRLVYSTFAVGIFSFLVASLSVGDLSALLRAMLGSSISFLGFGLIARLAPKGLGLGDVKLAAVLGLYLGWFGWGALISGWLFAFFSASVFGIIQILRRRAKMRSAIAFGPWMLLGSIMSLFWGNSIWAVYMNFLQRVMG